MRNKLGFAALFLILGIFETPAWAQCVMCGTALASSPEGQALASSFRYGIAILMVMPYLILGSIGYAIFRAYRKRIAARSMVYPTSV
jgi:hypothetical protein